MNKLNQNKGFTLIELLVVISIIGLLSSVVLAGLTSARKKAQGTQFVAQMNQLKNAFELYRNDKGKYPFEKLIDSSAGDDKGYSVLTTGLSGGKGLSDELVANKYISTIPKLSQCLPTTCWIGSPATIEDYGYITDVSTLGSTGYDCNGSYFKNYLFYACNNQITINYPYLTNGGGSQYLSCFCFGQ